MSYKTLYRKYRPNQFDDLIGQDHIVKTIENALRGSKISHAYLFCGPRGTGKTSMAKLLAKAVNCLDENNKPCGKCESCREAELGNHPDIIELDAASNNGVDQIREIVEKVKYTPIIGRYKVYIIDEVHMLSTSAFNALLKTLEEPPAYVIFILATTEPHKVLPTIISRCQRYNFTKVSNKDIQKRLEIVLDEEEVEYESRALELIADLADGGMRDALSILEQCLAYNQKVVSEEIVTNLFGIASTKDKLDLLKNIATKNYSHALNQLDEINNQGVDIKRLTREILIILKEVIVYRLTKEKNTLKSISQEQANELLSEVKLIFITRAIDIFVETEGQYFHVEDPRIYFEMALIKLMQMDEAINDEAVQITKEEVIKEITIKKATEIKPTPQISEDIVVEEETSEVNKEEKRHEETVETFSSEFILSLLVQANKQAKEEAIKGFVKLKDLKTNLRVCRFARILEETTVFASGENFMIVVGEYDSLANEINEMNMNKYLYQFSKEELGLDRVIYAITKPQQALFLKEFKERMDNNTLPNPVSVEKPTEEKQEAENSNKDETLELLVDVFGKENIKTKEE